MSVKQVKGAYHVLRNQILPAQQRYQSLRVEAYALRNDQSSMRVSSIHGKTSVLRFRFHEESRVTMNPETLFAILAYAIGMAYVIKRHK